MERADLQSFIFSFHYHRAVCGYAGPESSVNVGFASLGLGGSFAFGLFNVERALLSHSFERDDAILTLRDVFSFGLSVAQ